MNNEYIIVGIGDSIMSGYELKKSNKNSFIALGASYIQKKYPEKKVKHYNFAISNIHTSDLIDILNNKDNKYTFENNTIEKADLIELCIGSNDCYIEIINAILERTFFSKKEVIKILDNTFKKCKKDDKNKVNELFLRTFDDTYDINKYDINNINIKNIKNLKSKISMRELIALLAIAKSYIISHDKTNPLYEEAISFYKNAYKLGSKYKETTIERDFVDRKLEINFFSLVAKKISKILNINYSDLEKDGGKIYENMKNFEYRWNTIMNLIRKKNSTAKILVLNNYNPLTSVEKVLNNKAIRFILKIKNKITINLIDNKINECMDNETTKTKYKYNTVSLLKPFNSLLSVFYTRILLIDPHPNKLGNRIIHKILKKYY